jgi:hypothetical protein
LEKSEGFELAARQNCLVLEAQARQLDLVVVMELALDSAFRVLPPITAITKDLELAVV